MMWLGVHKGLAIRRQIRGVSERRKGRRFDEMFMTEWLVTTGKLMEEGG